MLLRESIQHCSTCAEQTPHSRRLTVFPRLVASVLLLTGVWCALQGSAGLLMAGVLSYAALLVHLRDRRKFWRIPCERCRGKELHEHRTRYPRLDRFTEIFLS